MSQRIIDRRYVGGILQRIYDSDIDFKLTLFSEGGYFYVAQGNRRIPLRGTTVEEAVTDLAGKLTQDFPESDFAVWWRGTFSSERNQAPL